MSNIVKLCANHLRSISNNYGVKLKSSHAHELVAAFFGYKSKAAMQADNLFPAENINQAQFLVLTPSLLINERRKCLDDLPSDLPDTYTLGEEMFVYLASEGKFTGKPFPSWAHIFKDLSHDYLINNDPEILSVSCGYNEISSNSFNESFDDFKPNIETTSHGIILTATNTYYGSHNIHSKQIDLSITVKLMRISGHVGYANPEITVADITNSANN